jgi:hypothetical protein
MIDILCGIECSLCAPGGALERSVDEKRIFAMIGSRSAALVTALLACLSNPASAQSIDQGFYYKLSTQFRGNGMKLDVFNGGPKNNMTRWEPDQDVSGQFWRFAANGDGTFRLRACSAGLECVSTSSTGAQTITNRI